MTKSNIEQLVDADVGFCEACGGLVSTVADGEWPPYYCSCPHCGKMGLHWVMKDCIPPGLSKDDE